MPACTHAPSGQRSKERLFGIQRTVYISARVEIGLYITNDYIGTTLPMTTVMSSVDGTQQHLSLQTHIDVTQEQVADSSGKWSEDNLDHNLSFHFPAFSLHNTAMLGSDPEFQGGKQEFGKPGLRRSMAAKTGTSPTADRQTTEKGKQEDWIRFLPLSLSLSWIPRTSFPFIFRDSIFGFVRVTSPFLKSRVLFLYVRHRKATHTQPNSSTEHSIMSPGSGC